MKDQALRLALEALESSEGELLKARAKIKQALAQPEPEPFAWYVNFGNEDEPNYFSKTKPDEPKALVRPLYTFPPKREWQALTDDEYSQLHDGLYQQGKSLGWVVDQIEEKLKERNL